MLFACVFVPYFPIQAALRYVHGGWREKPVALLDGHESLPRVFACNQRAELAGVEIGATKAQAEQCPEIILRKRAIALEDSAQAVLIDCASAFSPRIESTLDGAVILDIAGTERLFGPPSIVARMLAERAASMGFEVNIAIAANPDASLITAKGYSGITVVPAGDEANCLAPLPIDVLFPEVLSKTKDGLPGTKAEAAEILDGWGIRNCRELAMLPAVPLAERLGQAGLLLQQLARGKVERTLVPAETPAKFEESLELEEPVEDLKSLASILNRVLERISARLMARSLSTDEVHLRLGLEVYQERHLGHEPRELKLSSALSLFHERSLKFPVPLQCAETFSKLLQLDLESHRPSAPVKSICLEAKPARRRHTQEGLFAPGAPEPEKLEITLARLRGVVGETDERGHSRIGTPRILDSHRPDDFAVVPFAPQPGRSPYGSAPTLALHRFRPPLKATVRYRKNAPCHVSFKEISSAVLYAAGPWKSSGTWWNMANDWSREEWDIAMQLDSGMGLYRIFRDCRCQAWFVEGRYD